MKRVVFLFIFSLITTVTVGQEWFSSLDVAKRLALVQDKMLFVVWEDSFKYSMPLFIISDEGKASVIDVSKDTSFDALISEYFVPLRLQESEYIEFKNEAKNRTYQYIDKLNDDSVKIMDINGRILNVLDDTNNTMNLSFLINNYALNTSFLSSELENYSKQKSFMTSILLAIRYVDFAIFADETLRPELISLANTYLDESEKRIAEVDENKRDSYLQKIELVRIKELLILNNYKKAYRQIKRIDESEIDDLNNSLFLFLNYTVFKLMKDEINADLWKSKISSVDLKKAELIFKNIRNGSTN